MIQVWLACRQKYAHIMVYFFTCISSMSQDILPTLPGGHSLGTEILPTVTFVYPDKNLSWPPIDKYSVHRKGIYFFRAAKGSYFKMCTIALQYFHNDRNNRNKNLLLISILRMVFYWQHKILSETNLTNYLSLPLLTHIWFFYLLTRYPRSICEKFPRNFCCWCIVVWQNRQKNDENEDKTDNEPPTNPPILPLTMTALMDPRI